MVFDLFGEAFLLMSLFSLPPGTIPMDSFRYLKNMLKTFLYMFLSLSIEKLCFCDAVVGLREEPGELLEPSTGLWDLMSTAGCLHDVVAGVETEPTLDAVPPVMRGALRQE